jgi:hypothetical protein
MSQVAKSQCEQSRNLIGETRRAGDEAGHFLVLGPTIASMDIGAQRCILVPGGNDRWVARGHAKMMSLHDAIAEGRAAAAGPQFDA